jgi:hypothetical protein
MAPTRRGKPADDVLQLARISGKASCAKGVTRRTDLKQRALWYHK